MAVPDLDNRVAGGQFRLHERPQPVGKARQFLALLGSQGVRHGGLTMPVGAHASDRESR